MASGKFPTILTDSKSLKVTADFENGKIYVSPGLLVLSGKYVFFEGDSIDLEKRSCRIGFEVSGDFYEKKKIAIAYLVLTPELIEEVNNGNFDALPEATGCPSEEGEARNGKCPKTLDAPVIKEDRNLSYKLVIKPISSSKLENGVFFKPIATLIVNDKNKKIFQHYYGPCIFLPDIIFNYKIDDFTVKCLQNASGFPGTDAVLY